MKVLMKKPLGYPPTNLLMLLTLSLISIPNILPNLALFPFNKSIHPFFIPFCCVSILPFLCISVCYLFCLILSYYSLPLSYIPSVVHTKNKVKKKQTKNQSIHFFYKVQILSYIIFSGDGSRSSLLLPISVRLLTISLRHHLLHDFLHFHPFLLSFSLVLLPHSLFNLPP